MIAFDPIKSHDQTRGNAGRPPIRLIESPVVLLQKVRSRSDDVITLEPTVRRLVGTPDRCLYRGLAFGLRVSPAVALFSLIALDEVCSFGSGERTRSLTGWENHSV